MVRKMFHGNRRNSSRETEKQIQKPKKEHAYWFKNKEQVWAREVSGSDPVRPPRPEKLFRIISV